MGLFSTFSSKSSTSVSSSSGSRLNQHGSRKGEINKSEFNAGLRGDIRKNFHGSEREMIQKMLKSELDKSSSNARGVVTRDEAAGVIEDVGHIYSKHDADKLRNLLAKRQG